MFQDLPRARARSLVSIDHGSDELFVLIWHASVPSSILVICVYQRSREHSRFAKKLVSYLAKRPYISALVMRLTSGDLRGQELDSTKLRDLLDYRRSANLHGQFERA